MPKGKYFFQKMRCRLVAILEQESYFQSNLHAAKMCVPSTTSWTKIVKHQPKLHNNTWSRDKLPKHGIRLAYRYNWASLIAQLVKNLPAMQETWVLSLGWEDPLEKGEVKG